jgi:2-polyprenyl-6-hydroxyphenyl methylase/3-demethylubiquinone-9 3-methyltransferase
MQAPTARAARPAGADLAIVPQGGDTAAPRNLERRLRLLESLLPGLSGLRLLDAGCGAGEYVRALAARGADVQGIEVEASKLTAADARVAGRIQQGDLERTGFDAGRFDAVLLNEVLEHVPDDAAGLREMHRILAPRGSLVVFSPNRLHPFETHGVFARRSGRRISHATPFVPWIPVAIGRRFLRYWARNYWPGELRELLRSAGFRIERWGFLWPTFENISGAQPAWMRRLTPVLRAASGLAERTPGLRRLGASQWILATRSEDPG